MTVGERARMLLPVAMVLAVLAPAGCEGDAPPSADPKDPAYAAALAAANDFLHAWREKDLSAGRNLLSERLTRAHTLSQIEDVVCGHPSAQHAAFTVSGGEPAGEGRMAFRVRLFFRFTGRADDRVESSAHRMVMARDDRGRWQVDVFPFP
jgi:hypothetical protein